MCIGQLPDSLQVVILGTACSAALINLQTKKHCVVVQVKAGHMSDAVMTKAEREINADLLRQQARLAAGK